MTTHARTGTPKPPTRRKRPPPLAPHKYHLLLALSDWHLDESIKLEAAGGGMVNRYGRAIATERVSRLIESICAVFEMYAQDTSAARPVITVWLGGDFITGAIHEESRTQTWCNPSQAIAFALEQISRVLTAIRVRCRPSRIDVVCSVGNHERTTPKPSVTVPAGFSLATGLYAHLRERHETEWATTGQAGTWQDPPAEGPISYIPLSFGHLGRFFHGDARGFKYSGGVGGLSVPLIRFLGRANSEPGAAGAITMIGHYHTFGWHETAQAISNGSLCGFNGYARSIGASFEFPCQAMAVLSRHGNKGPVAVHKLICAE